MSKLQMQANLSIDRSGGAELLPVVIEKVRAALTEKFPEADIDVRKGYFQTIDGIWASEPSVEHTINQIVADVRKQVLSPNA